MYSEQTCAIWIYCKAWCLNLRYSYMSVFGINQNPTYGSSSDYEQRFGKGGGTLLVLLDKLPEFIRRMPLDFYFDNYFTSFPLFNHLTSLNHGGTGAIRENHIPKQCPLKFTKDMKKESRGAIEIAFDDNSKIALVK